MNLAEGPYRIDPVRSSKPWTSYRTIRCRPREKRRSTSHSRSSFRLMSFQL